MEDVSNIEEIRSVLGELHIFQGLTGEQTELLLRDFSFLRVRKGDTVFFQAEESTDFYILFAGAIRASLLGSDGQELILATFGKGDFFGEMSFLDGKPRSATITAQEDSLLGMLKRQKFLNSVRNDPTIALGLLAALLKRMRTANEMIESFAFLSVNHRVVKFLLQSAETAAQGKEAGGAYRVGRTTHKELAAKIGSSREAVSKALKFLAQKGMVREDGGDFLIYPAAQAYIEDAL